MWERGEKDGTWTLKGLPVVITATIIAEIAAAEITNKVINNAPM